MRKAGFVIRSKLTTGGHLFLVQHNGEERFEATSPGRAMLMSPSEARDRVERQDLVPVAISVEELIHELGIGTIENHPEACSFERAVREFYSSLNSQIYLQAQGVDPKELTSHLVLGDYIQIGISFVAAVGVATLLSAFIPSVIAGILLYFALDIAVFRPMVTYLRIGGGDRAILAGRMMTKEEQISWVHGAWVYGFLAAAATTALCIWFWIRVLGYH